MSTTQVERPTMPSCSSHTLASSLADANIQTMELVPGLRQSIPSTSHGPVIDVDDDERGHEAAERRSIRRVRQAFVIGDDEPPVNRRRMTSAPQEFPASVVDNNNGEGSSGHAGRRRVDNGAQNRPIVVSDSDEMQSTSVASGLRARPRVTRRRRDQGTSASFRIFSPSPAPQPIIADPIPFPILPPASNGNPPPTHPPQAENPSPRIGSGIHLGGGLLSHTFSAGRRRAPASFSLAGFGNLLRSVTFTSGGPSLARRAAGAMAHAVSDDSRQEDRLSVFERLFVNWHPHHAQTDQDVDFIGIGGNRPWLRHDPAHPLGPDYEPGMTHPGRPGLGWTYDFCADDGSPGEAGAEILVCARCLDPLLANAEGMVDVDEEEQRNRRLWGLRCGHVLDGKCAGVLMRPRSGDMAAEKAMSKGKQREEVHDLMTPQDTKGKGKVPAIPLRVPTPLSPAIPENSIRSRLRSRNRQETQSELQPPIAATGRRGRGTKRKRGTGDRGAKEVVEDRYEWICPVAGCGRGHHSIKVGGVWKMDPEDGAVGVFV